MRRRDVLHWLAGLGLIGLAPGPALARKSRQSDREDNAGRSGKAKAQGAGPGRESAKAPWRPGKQLVVVLLKGGPDGLSVAAPVTDPLYAFLRPTTALAPDCGGLELGNGFVLHPALSGLAPLYAQKRLAVIPACAMPGQGATHAAALADFAAGAPTGQVKGKDGKAGWLGRLALALGGERSQMLVASSSPVYAGAPHYTMIAPGRGESLPGLPVEDQTLFEGAGRLYAAAGGALGKAFAVGREARQDLLAKLLEESRRAAAEAIPTPHFAAFGQRFGRELAQRRDAALGFVAVGGFDTHSGQGAAKGYLADRLREAGQGLAGLLAGLGPAAADTVVLVLGEFGRSARENAFGGTDNGLGGVLLVLGGPVAGGRVWGEWPGLAGHRLAGGRDVAVGTDWRDVAAAVAVGHLGLPEKKVGEVFPGFAPSPGLAALVG
ncbi:DUF1501 domain-containing protein [Desulfovibrio aerotolerans]|uniref:DUF1501 domain-containing protein n=1 Tax=Solidesulfovibrio aerotolerans TaxID=295255 RepID=A0A7C9IVN5_9BACT|nr:DUF1501 domain-containing protein [Solidesulfovibrio aerotolerans]